MKTFHTFKNADTFQKYLHTKHQTCTFAGAYGGCIDYVTVAGITYQMEEYDMGGQYLELVNIHHKSRLSIHTADRYTQGYADAEVSITPLYSYRTDITYHRAIA